MASRSSRRKQAAHAATPVALTGPERELEQAILSAIARLRELAGILVSAELGQSELGQSAASPSAQLGQSAASPRAKLDELQEREEAVRQACQTVAEKIPKINLFSLLGQENEASMFLMGLFAERAALGHELTGHDESGREFALLSPEAQEEISDAIMDLERLSSAAKVEAYLDQEQIVAPLALGAYLARAGDSDLFAATPWFEPAVRACLAGAAITTAVLTRLAQRYEALGSEFKGLSDHPVTFGDQAAIAAYWAAEQESEVDLEGFGTVSQVVEDILLEAGFLEDLDLPDVHRLSGSLMSAFAAGVEGRELEDDDHESGQAQELLFETRALGRAARLAHEAQIDALPLNAVFGGLPGEDLVQ